LFSGLRSQPFVWGVNVVIKKQNIHNRFLNKKKKKETKTKQNKTFFAADIFES